MNRPIPTTPDERRRQADIQSGDTKGMSNARQAHHESVYELAVEGQSIEAAPVSGVENADDPYAHEVRIREVRPDDVPRENEDNDSTNNDMTSNQRRFQLMSSSPGRLEFSQ